MTAGAERDVVAIACAISAGIHAALVPAHLADGAAAGVGFAAAAGLLALVAAGVRRSTTVAPAAAAVLFGVLIGSYLLATTSGIPLLHPDPDQVTGLGLSTKAVEAVGLVAAAHVLSVPAAGRRSRTTSRVREIRAERPIPLALTSLIALFSALVALAVSSGHETHAHEHDAAASVGVAR